MLLLIISELYYRIREMKSTKKETVKPTVRKRFTVKDKSIIRTLFETGKYELGEIGAKFGIPVKTLYKWSCYDKWNKGVLAPRVEELQQESIVEMFAKAGMPKERLIDKVVEGISTPDELIFEGPKGEQICTPVPDYKTRLQYIKEANAMQGNYPEKNSKDAGIHVDKLLISVSGLSGEELLRARDEIRERG